MKPRILVFSRYYLPGHLAGGPIRTIANMVERLGDAFEFRIVTLDRDLGSDRPYSGIPANIWIARGNAQVRYVSPDRFGLREVARILRATPHDVIYLNSFFEPRFTQQVLISRWLRRTSDRPIVIAPRGEFSEGALRLKKHKKRLFIGLARIFGLYENVIWQASSTWEAGDIRRVMSPRIRRLLVWGCKSRIAIASDMASIGNASEPLMQATSPRVAGTPLRACTLSRISPQKNLDFSLRMLALVRVPVHFSIYGPIEDAEYWAECQELIRALPTHVEVTYEGALESASVVAELEQCDLFVFPTRGENFGHVIHEALRAGLPLLLSDQTPWRQLVERGVGWDLPLADPAEFARRIDEVADWSHQQYVDYAARARAMASRVADDPATLEANRRLFLEAIENVGRDLASKTAKGAGSV